MMCHSPLSFFLTERHPLFDWLLQLCLAHYAHELLLEQVALQKARLAAAENIWRQSESTMKGDTVWVQRVDESREHHKVRIKMWQRMDRAAICHIFTELDADGNGKVLVTSLCLT